MKRSLLTRASVGSHTSLPLLSVGSHTPPPDRPLAAALRSPRAVPGSSSQVRVVDLVRTWDKDGDGGIDKGEFRACVAELGLQATEEEVRRCLRQQSQHILISSSSISSSSLARPHHCISGEGRPLRSHAAAAARHRGHTRHTRHTDACIMLRRTFRGMNDTED